MNPIGNYTQLPTKKESKINSERAELISKFLDRINSGRKGTQYKPMTARGVAMKLAHVPTEDLWAFYRMCDTAKCGFGAAFFGSLKVKKLST